MDLEGQFVKIRTSEFFSRKWIVTAAFARGTLANYDEEKKQIMAGCPASN